MSTSLTFTSDVYDPTFTPQGGGVNGWQASDHGSGLRLDIHNGAPLHIFEEVTGDFPAAFTMIKPGVLAIFVAKNGCFLCHLWPCLTLCYPNPTQSKIK